MVRTLIPFLLSLLILFSRHGRARAEGSTPPRDLPASDDWPDLMTLDDGTAVTSPGTWEKRREELLEKYRHYVYGRLPEDGPRVSCGLGDTGPGKTGKMTVTAAREGRAASFGVFVTLPRGEAPEKGFPCYIEYAFARGDAAPGPSPNCIAAAKRGYAGITYYPTEVAGDNGLHTGMFYTLYPFEPLNAEYPGVLAVWAWGVGRIIDALEGGAGEALSIDPAACIVAGVSRYGKSALVAGAFDERIRVTVPACSGAGGAALFRGSNHGKTYDLSSLGGEESWTNASVNEPLADLQGGEGYWFCRNFLSVPSEACFPVEQYMLCALCAGADRHLIVVTGIVSEGWNYTEGQCLAWAASRKVFALLANAGGTAMIVHPDGHAILPSDLEKILDHCDVYLYGKDVSETASGLAEMHGEFFLRDNRDRLDPAFDLLASD